MAPDTVVNVPIFAILATKIQKLVAMLATRTLQVPCILTLYKPCNEIRHYSRKVNHTFGLIVE